MRFILASVAMIGILTMLPLASQAVTCAAGVYRAGCAGPNGAGVVRRPYYRPPATAHYYRPPARAHCASGPYRAGCAGPNGAAVVRRPY
jgi:hypothetical protein